MYKYIAYKHCVYKYYVEYCLYNMYSSMFQLCINTHPVLKNWKKYSVLTTVINVYLWVVRLCLTLFLPFMIFLIS